MQILKHKGYLLLIIPLLFWPDDACFSGERGELRLEGQHIEHLVLRGRDGHAERFNRPGDTINLPVGKYRLKDVRLKNGFNYSSRPLKYKWITVAQDEPAVFKVGAPLKQIVRIIRRGPILEIDYELVGVGGETYASKRSMHPKFTVFKNQTKVGGDEFEFG
ncbi:MAG: hypothetical protein JXM79_13835 [Sedimentisphaerales bacterium]|nr:hypothetical protein [Sedimentisphaerales bacterium]